MPSPGRHRALVEAVEHAGQPGRRAAEREDAGERAAHVDAERGDHVPVLHAGADDQAGAGTGEQQPQRQQEQHGGADQHEAHRRDAGTGHVDRAAEPRRQLPGLRVGAPDGLQERRDREAEADRGEHLVERAPVERSDHDEFGERGDGGAGDDRGHERRRPGRTSRRCGRRRSSRRSRRRRRTRRARSSARPSGRRSATGRTRPGSTARPARGRSR